MNITSNDFHALSVITRRRITFALLPLLLLGVGAFLFHHYALRNRTQDMIIGGTLTQTSAALVFENSVERISFTAPAAWSRFGTPSAQVMVRGDGCSFGLLEQRTTLTVSALATAESRDLSRRHPEAHPIISARSLAGHPSLSFSGTYTDSDGGSMTQTYRLVDRGPNVITLIETATAPGCAQAFAAIESSLRL